MRQSGEPSMRFGVTLPAWSVYALGGLLVAMAVAIPWLVRWQGFLRGAVPPQDTSAEGSKPRVLRPVLVKLPGGELWMGSPDTEEDRWDNEGPRHRVRISSFEICQTEVTQAQWQTVMGTNPSDCEYGCGDDLPVQNVSWFDAVKFMNELTRLEKQRDGEILTPCYEIRGEQVEWMPGCTGYRLPTEAEWEYAARARSATAYSFGDEAAGLGEHAWYDENSDGKVHEVADKRPNAWRLHDVHGNVWEWVWDWYAPYPDPPPAEPRSDPVGPDEAQAPTVEWGEEVDGEIQTVQGKARVLRGGSFVSGAWYLRSAYRGWSAPADRVRVHGVRCARGGAPALFP
jgi:formylglycine-generating enzyme